MKSAVYAGYMRLTLLLLLCVCTYAAAVWFIDPLGMPDAQATRGGAVIGVLTFVASAGAWLVALGVVGDKNADQ
jgi:hypothetical protein